MAGPMATGGLAVGLHTGKAADGDVAAHGVAVQGGHRSAGGTRGFRQRDVAAKAAEDSSRLDSDARFGSERALYAASDGLAHQGSSEGEAGANGAGERLGGERLGHIAALPRSGHGLPVSSASDQRRGRVTGHALGCPPGQVRVIEPNFAGHRLDVGRGARGRSDDCRRHPVLMRQQ